MATKRKRKPEPPKTKKRSKLMCKSVTVSLSFETLCKLFGVFDAAITMARAGYSNPIRISFAREGAYVRGLSCEQADALELFCKLLKKIMEEPNGSYCFEAFEMLLAGNLDALVDLAPSDDVYEILNKMIRGVVSVVPFCRLKTAVRTKLNLPYGWIYTTSLHNIDIAHQDHPYLRGPRWIPYAFHGDSDTCTSIIVNNIDTFDYDDEDDLVDILTELHDQCKTLSPTARMIPLDLLSNYHSALLENGKHDNYSLFYNNLEPREQTLICATQGIVGSMALKIICGMSFEANDCDLYFSPDDQDDVVEALRAFDDIKITSNAIEVAGDNMVFNLLQGIETIDEYVHNIDLNINRAYINQDETLQVTPEFMLGVVEKKVRLCTTTCVLASRVEKYKQRGFTSQISEHLIVQDTVCPIHIVQLNKDTLDMFLEHETLPCVFNMQNHYTAIPRNSRLQWQKGKVEIRTRSAKPNEISKDVEDINSTVCYVYDVENEKELTVLYGHAQRQKKPIAQHLS